MKDAGSRVQSCLVTTDVAGITVLCCTLTLLLVTSIAMVSCRQILLVLVICSAHAAVLHLLWSPSRGRQSQPANEHSSGHIVLRKPHDLLLHPTTASELTLACDKSGGLCDTQVLMCGKQHHTLSMV